MTELQVTVAIEMYQRRRRRARDLELRRSMRGLDTAEQFLAALRGLDGLRRGERASAEILQTLA